MVSFSTQVEAGGLSVPGQHGPHVRTLHLCKEEGEKEKRRGQRRKGS